MVRVRPLAQEHLHASGSAPSKKWHQSLFEVCKLALKEVPKKQKMFLQWQHCWNQSVSQVNIKGLKKKKLDAQVQMQGVSKLQLTDPIWPPATEACRSHLLYRIFKLRTVCTFLKSWKKIEKKILWHKKFKFQCPQLILYWNTAMLIYTLSVADSAPGAERLQQKPSVPHSPKHWLSDPLQTKFMDSCFSVSLINHW